MNLNHIKSFISIVKNKNFSKAANELYITQPTISNHINKLEKELDSKLFIRNSKQVSLTESGELFYKYALNMIQMESNLKNQINEYKNDIAGHLKIMASTVPEKYYLINEVDAFHKKFPSVKFDIRRSDSKKIIKAINQSKIDFGIIGTTLLDSQLVYTELFADEIILVGNKKFYNSIDSLTLEELYNYKFISREKGSGTRKEVECHFNSKGYSYDKLDIIFSFESNDSIMKLLQSSNYLTFISKRVFNDTIYSKDIFKKIELKETINRSFYFAYNKNRILSPLSSKFKEFILNRTIKNA